MTFDRKDFKESVASREVSHEREMMPLIRVLQGAAPVMNTLMTESDAWNRYLAILSGFAERLKASKAYAQFRLSAPDIWEPFQLTKLKSDILVADAGLEMLQVAMELPKALIEGGAKAQEIVNQFEVKHENTKNTLS